MKHEMDFSSKFAVGTEASTEQRVTKEAIADMAKLSQDYNPIHVDEEYARSHYFGRCIAHGLFCESMISRLLGTDLPGEGTVLLSQSFRYLAPVYVGDTVTARVRIERADVEKRRLKLSTACVDQTGKTLVDGTADVMVLE